MLYRVERSDIVEKMLNKNIMFSNLTHIHVQLMGIIQARNNSYTFMYVNVHVIEIEVEFASHK